MLLQVDIAIQKVSSHNPKIELNCRYCDPTSGCLANLVNWKVYNFGKSNKLDHQKLHGSGLVSKMDGRNFDEKIAERALDLKQIPEYPCALQYYFDDMIMCFTPLMQLRYYYRFGDIKPCSQALQDWLWCLTTRSMREPVEEQRRLRQRRIDQWRRLYQGPNSEQVWQIREVPFTPQWHNNRTEENYQSDQLGQCEKNMIP